MKSKSNQIDLTNESAERILSENGFNECGLNVYSIAKRFSGSGHYELSCEIMKQNDTSYELLNVSKTTTDMTMIDAWNEEPEYFVNGSWYDSAEEVMNAAFNEIISSEYNQEKIQEFIEN